ncbi:MAG: glycosyltransferase [Nitrospira sp.]|nr:glycosyltransferase [Nitrospira sp.]
MSDQDRHFRLSVLLVTFNHENYIRQSLRSLFGQVFNGPIELVIADDGSSDNTLAIIRQYEGKDQRFHCKYLDNKANLGIAKNYQRGFAACSGEYVAVLEGDDYWVNPIKLQRQSDFLDAHWECDLCSVNYFVYEEERAQFTARAPIGDGHRFIGARDLIADNLVGNFSTCMYRKSALDALPKNLFDIKSYDWIVNICVARQSLIGFLERPMSVYRLHSAGAWAQMPHIEKLKTQLDLIPIYDELTSYTFHADFDMLTRRLHVAIARQAVLNHVPSVFMKFARAVLPSGLKRRLVFMFRGIGTVR